MRLFQITLLASIIFVVLFYWGLKLFDYIVLEKTIYESVVQEKERTIQQMKLEMTTNINQFNDRLRNIEHQVEEIKEQQFAKDRSKWGVIANFCARSCADQSLNVIEYMKCESNCFSDKSGVFKINPQTKSWFSGPIEFSRFRK